MKVASGVRDPWSWQAAGQGLQVKCMLEPSYLHKTSPNTHTVRKTPSLAHKPAPLANSRRALKSSSTTSAGSEIQLLLRDFLLLITLPPVSS